GQHDIKYLDKLKLPVKLYQKLEKYMGLKGIAARAFLTDNPLILTEEEALLINKKVKNDKALEVAALYNRDSKLKFNSLDGALQTVIMSVAFQYGDLSKRTPNFWRVVTSGDWKQ